jgi:acyl-CoA synthetase (NDP forming)
MNGIENSGLYSLTHPRSVAFWGASTNPTAMGSVLMSSLLAMGFQGPVYPIHPRDREVKGRPAFKCLSDVGAPVDLAVLVLPTQLAPDVLDECGRNGVKAAIVVTAGFAEKGDEGRRLQERMVAIARKYGITMLGPNCLGVVNPDAKVNTMFMQYETSAGFIGMASQSGSFVTQMFDYLQERDLGFSQAISVGNEALTDVADCLEYLGNCPKTKVIALYLETVRRGRDFVRVAREASQKKPIVAYYVGGTRAGGSAAFSHTGAMAGSDELYDGMFRQGGVIRACSVEEMFDFCHVLGRQPLPQGNRFVILTHSGGPGAAAADAADRCGMGLAQMSRETLGRIEALVPHTASVGNPVDLTFNRTPADYMQTIPEIILSDDAVDGLFIYVILPQSRARKSFIEITGDPQGGAAMADQFVEGQCQALARVAAASGKPVVAATFCGRSEPFVQHLEAGGIPVLPSPERAVRALAAAARYAAAKRGFA